ncbi:hypothetical protein AALO_G00140030 [Alosa alosa]|uniref:Uncharacterized protein n=1 Tax=Alosa alosa TaxID=278164 RepID=A0AAV6GJY3_9TELE|nr:hypothetical protein AALO_G00140030 [Alosa alosa]
MRFPGYSCTGDPHKVVMRGGFWTRAQRRSALQLQHRSSTTLLLSSRLRQMQESGNSGPPQPPTPSSSSSTPARGMGSRRVEHIELLSCCQMLRSC